MDTVSWKYVSFICTAQQPHYWRSVQQTLFLIGTPGCAWIMTLLIRIIYSFRIKLIWLLAIYVSFLRFTLFFCLFLTSFFFSQHIFCEYVILKLKTVEQKMTVYIVHSIVNYSTVSYKLQLTGQPSHIVFFLLPVMTQVSTFMYGKQALHGFPNC